MWSDTHTLHTPEEERRVKPCFIVLQQVVLIVQSIDSALCVPASTFCPHLQSKTEAELISSGCLSPEHVWCGGAYGVFFLVRSDLCLDCCPFSQHRLRNKGKHSLPALQGHARLQWGSGPPPRVAAVAAVVPVAGSFVCALKRKEKEKVSRPFYFATSSLKFHSVLFNDPSLCVFHFFFLSSLHLSNKVMVLQQSERNTPTQPMQSVCPQPPSGSRPTG